MLLRGGIKRAPNSRSRLSKLKPLHPSLSSSNLLTAKQDSSSASDSNDAKKTKKPAATKSKSTEEKPKKTTTAAQKKEKKAADTVKDPPKKAVKKSTSGGKLQAPSFATKSKQGTSFPFPLPLAFWFRPLKSCANSSEERSRKEIENEIDEIEKVNEG